MAAAPPSAAPMKKVHKGKGVAVGKQEKRGEAMSMVRNE